MAAATASSIESSQSLLQSESHVQRTYTESTKAHSEHRVKKTKSTRKHKDEGSISVSKSSEKLSKKMKPGEGVTNPTCSKCSRPVYAMERVKAERQSWHRECFRCSVCNKQLTVETYESDHMTLYCKSHFRQLFEPKPVDEPDNVDATPRKHQMIICESNPVELPPDVVRASDKSDPGLESLSSLDVRSRWEVFERAPSPERPSIDVRPPKEKGAHLLAKLAKFKAKGMDIGISDEYLNGVPVEASSSEPEDEEDEDSVLKKSYAQSMRVEQPVALCNMSEIVGRFESGSRPDMERHRSRKQEIQNIRSRLFMGKQAKIKEMYEQSVAQSEQSITSAEKISRELELDSDKSRAIKERFESGQIYNDENRPPTNREVDDPALFNEGIAKKSRSIFLELDANAKSAGPLSPPPQEPPKRKEIPFIPKDVVRAADKVDEVHIETADITDRFRFFETYKPDTARKEFRMTPPRQTQRPKSPSPELYVDPSVMRSTSMVEDPGVASSRQTASKMINVFRNMEEALHQDQTPAGPKPLKRFTPPPEGVSRPEESSEEESAAEEDSEEERERQWRETRESDDALKQAQVLARTKSFRDKFENWRETERSPSSNAVVIPRENGEEDGDSQLETAKSLRAKFENMTVKQTSVSKSVVSKVNRFV